MQTEIQLSRLCPKCKETIFHKNRRILLQAQRLNQSCLKCRPTKRKLTSEEWSLRKVSAAEYGKEYRRIRKMEIAIKKKAYYDNLKLEGLRVLGGKCECCLEREPKFLTLEHKMGRTEKDIHTGKKAWAQAKAEGYPKDKYTVLCFNCNCAKGAFGICPHKQ